MLSKAFLLYYVLCDTASSGLLYWVQAGVNRRSRSQIFFDARNGCDDNYVKLVQPPAHPIPDGERKKSKIWILRIVKE